jgi:hypothetical protein
MGRKVILPNPQHSFPGQCPQYIICNAFLLHQREKDQRKHHVKLQLRRPRENFSKLAGHSRTSDLTLTLTYWPSNDLYWPSQLHHGFKKQHHKILNQYDKMLVTFDI